MTTKAVILARGLGTRMRKADDTAALDEQTAKIAATGVKAMIPTLGRPFLDFVLTTLADSGYTEACLVIGPEHDQVREYYGKTLKLSRIKVSFAIQEKPLGTADAVRPAEEFAAGESFLMINSDNFYPTDSFTALAKAKAPGVAVYKKSAMLTGNIPADRISKFSVVETRPDGSMARILEKPDEATLARFGEEAYVSMNCWLFDSKIFDACRAIKPSPRGEYEITDAVQHCIDVFGQSFGVHKFNQPVLDLSSRGDIASVNEKLRGIEVRL